MLERLDRLVHPRLGIENELAVDKVNRDVGRGWQLTVQDLLAEAVFDLALNRTTKRAGSEGWVKPDLNQTVFSSLGELDRGVAVFKAV